MQELSINIYRYNFQMAQSAAGGLGFGAGSCT